MLDEGLAELVVGGARILVPRDVGVTAFERNQVLLTQGRVEVAQVPLADERSVVLRLVLGTPALALIEPVDGGAAPYPPLPGPAEDVPITAAEVFPDFDAHW